MTRFLSAFLLITLAFLIFACNSQKKARENPFSYCDTVRIDTRMLSDDSGMADQYVSDSFINMASEVYTINNLREDYSRLLSMKRVPFRNVHDTTQVDTIYHFTGKRDSIKFYRSRSKAFMILLDVSSPELGLDRCIRPGMSKKTFLSIFQIPGSTSDTIRISNRDGTLIFIFYFRDNTLKRIESDIYFG